jgi:hypothetical protein
VRACGDSRDDKSDLKSDDDGNNDDADNIDDTARTRDDS